MPPIPLHAARSTCNEELATEVKELLAAASSMVSSSTRCAPTPSCSATRRSGGIFQACVFSTTAKPAISVGPVKHRGARGRGPRPDVTQARQPLRQCVTETVVAPSQEPAGLLHADAKAATMPPTVTACYSGQQEIDERVHIIDLYLYLRNPKSGEECASMHARDVPSLIKY